MEKDELQALGCIIEKLTDGKKFVLLVEKEDGKKQFVANLVLPGKTGVNRGCLIDFLKEAIKETKKT